MKLGFGLYRHMLTSQNFQFAKQAGCTHIVAHWTNYFAQDPALPETGGETQNWGVTRNQDKPWTAEELTDLRKSVEAGGLKLEAIENFDPSHWYDILLDGPNRDQQIETVKTNIRAIGAAGIPVMGYNFSIAGVWGHVRGKYARGDAETVAFLGDNGPKETPIPNGEIWNMLYDPDAPDGVIEPFGSDELWRRLENFLKDVVPVAEEAGVRLALHPDDPPMPTLRGTPRLVNQPHLYQKVLDLVPSRSNAIELCMGSIQEMTEGDVYSTLETYARQDAIGYIHFRNVRGKVPEYYEVFVDEGDIDMVKALRVLKDVGYDGVLIPDHTPHMQCDAPWHAGMAYALGYMKAAMSMVQSEG